jgi:hypothetical protein
LLAVDEALDLPAAVEIFVPRRGDDSDFRVANRAQLFFGVVVARTKGNDKFIHQRQGGTDGFHEGKAQAGGIA